jgi:hypothetical protein
MFGGFEAGVSVFDGFQVSADLWNATGDAWEKHRKFTKNSPGLNQKGPWFLVTGSVLLQKGRNDQETLLKNVVPIEEFTWVGGDSFKVASHTPSGHLQCHPGYPECECKSVVRGSANKP